MTHLERDLLRLIGVLDLLGDLWRDRDLRGLDRERRRLPFDLDRDRLIRDGDLLRRFDFDLDLFRPGERDDSFSDTNVIDSYLLECTTNTKHAFTIYLIPHLSNNFHYENGDQDCSGCIEMAIKHFYNQGSYRI